MHPQRAVSYFDPAKVTTLEIDVAQDDVPQLDVSPVEVARPAKRVLLLEDRDDFREVLCDHLVSRRFQVIFVPSGVEGVREIKKDPFDLIICDMMMPGMGGEMFYWAAVLATFAMGTAAGDMTAYTLRLGWFTSGVLYTVIFAIPIVARRVFGLNEVFAFWFAYVITRPLGASYADWLGVPQALGGLNFGRGTVAVGLTVAIVIWVAYLSITKLDVERSDPAATGASSPAFADGA